MCDFRAPPISVINIQTGENLPANFQGNIPVGEKDKQKVVGVYYLCASGSSYAYFDGQGWYYNSDDWGTVTEFGRKTWPDTGGKPPGFDKYKFVFPSESFCIWNVYNKHPHHIDPGEVKMLFERLSKPCEADSPNR